MKILAKELKEWVYSDWSDPQLVVEEVDCFNFVFEDWLNQLEDDDIITDLNDLINIYHDTTGKYYNPEKIFKEWKSKQENIYILVPKKHEEAIKDFIKTL